MKQEDGKCKCGNGFKQIGNGCFAHFNSVLKGDRFSCNINQFVEDISLKTTFKPIKCKPVVFRNIEGKKERVKPYTNDDKENIYIIAETYADCFTVCKKDKKNRIPKGINKKVPLQCIPVTDQDGNVFGAQLDYGKDGFDQFENNCGKGILEIR